MITGYLGQSIYNSFLVYCRELAPTTVSLTGDRATTVYMIRTIHLIIIFNHVNICAINCFWAIMLGILKLLPVKDHQKTKDQLKKF